MLELLRVVLALFFDQIEGAPLQILDVEPVQLEIFDRLLGHLQLLNNNLLIFLLEIVLGLQH